MKATMATKQGLYSKVRVIENYNGIERLYVKKTNLNTYIVLTSERIDLDNMVDINGQYHFGTLKELRAAI